ncbi:MAG TPA: regulator [Cytophagales bacterium]|jgi:DNA-binding NtrC family response regulator|nr:regulator [Cytophagales bacterium]
MPSEPTVKIFAVEDDPVYARFLDYLFGLNPDFEVTFFQSGKDFLKNLHKKPTIVTLDYSLPDMSGEEVLKEVKQFDPNVFVIIVSSQESIGTAVDLLKMGAYDYIVKNDETRERLLYALNNAKKNIQLVKELDTLKQEVSEKYEFENSIIGKSKAIKKVFGLLEKAVKTNITVSISGETGTGKELVAKAIHYNSTRKHKPFVPVNIAAVPSELIESELFGHEKGAFTGAVTRRIGKFEEAQEGTIFLDEIGEMPLNLQAKLLRVIQEKEVTRIGGNNTIKLNVRIIVATHKDLAEEAQNGNFREDLYYRLLGLPIWLPPLRDRETDVLLIASFFLKSFCEENEMPLKVLSREAKEKLLSYSFPGNVRELKSVIELGAVMSNEDEIMAEDIKFSSVIKEDNFTFENMSLREYNFKIIRNYLDKYNNNVLEVARRLDIGKSTIYRYLKEMEAENF